MTSTNELLERLPHLRSDILDGASVKPIGKHGMWCLYRDARGERHALLPVQHTRAAIAALFAPNLGELYARFPDGKGGWHAWFAAEALMGAAARAGVVWDLTEAGFAQPRATARRRAG